MGEEKVDLLPAVQIGDLTGDPTQLFTLETLRTLTVEAVAHPGSLMLASWGLGLLSLYQGHVHRALPRLERAVCLCQDAGFLIYFPLMAAPLGTAYTRVGRGTDAIPLLTQAMEQTTATEMAGFQALCGLPLGEAQKLAGHLKEARAISSQRSPKDGAATPAWAMRESGVHSPVAPAEVVSGSWSRA